MLCQNAIRQRHCTQSLFPARGHFWGDRQRILRLLQELRLKRWFKGKHVPLRNVTCSFESIILHALSYSPGGLSFGSYCLHYFIKLNLTGGRKVRRGYNEITSPCSPLLRSHSFLAAVPSFPIQAKPIPPSFARGPGLAAAGGLVLRGRWVGGSGAGSGCRADAGLWCRRRGSGRSLPQALGVTFPVTDDRKQRAVTGWTGCG